MGTVVVIVGTRVSVGDVLATIANGPPISPDVFLDAVISCVQTLLNLYTTPLVIGRAPMFFPERVQSGRETSKRPNPSKLFIAVPSPFCVLFDRVQLLIPT